MFLRVRPARSSFRCFSAARLTVHSAQAWKHVRSQRPSISSNRRRAQLGKKGRKKRGMYNTAEDGQKKKSGDRGGKTATTENQQAPFFLLICSGCPAFVGGFVRTMREKLLSRSGIIACYHVPCSLRASNGLFRGILSPATKGPASLRSRVYLFLSMARAGGGGGLSTCPVTGLPPS